MWYLVGKSAPQDFLNKLVYVAITHDARIEKIDTVCRTRVNLHRGAEMKTELT